MKKRKENNNHKRYVRQAEIALRDTAMAFSTGGDGLVRVITFSTCKEVLAGKSLIDAFNKIPHRWSFIIAVTERDSNKTETCTPLVYVLPYKMFRDEVVVAINAEHKKMVDKTGHEHICGAAWIAAPWAIPEEYDEDLVTDLFRKLGAWDCPTMKEESEIG